MQQRFNFEFSPNHGFSSRFLQGFIEGFLGVVQPLAIPTQSLNGLIYSLMLFTKREREEIMFPQGIWERISSTRQIAAGREDSGGSGGERERWREGAVAKRKPACGERERQYFSHRLLNL